MPIPVSRTVKRNVTPSASLLVDADQQLDVAAVRELHRVGQKVGQHLTEAQRVAHERAAFAEQPRIGHVEQQLDVLFVRALPEQRERIARDVLDPEAPLLELELARFDLREIEDVVDDREQRFAALWILLT